MAQFLVDLVFKFCNRQFHLGRPKICSLNMDARFRL